MKIKNIILVGGILITFASSLLAEWNITKPVTEVPEALSGTIFGRKFSLGKAEWSSNTLSIESDGKEGGWPESELIIFVDRNAKETEWTITPDKSKFGDPHIHMKFAKKGANFPGTLMFMGEYCMYLKLEKKDDKEATFKIHISLPDYKKSYLLGTFKAKLTN